MTNEWDRSGNCLNTGDVRPENGQDVRQPNLNREVGRAPGAFVRMGLIVGLTLAIIAAPTVGFAGDKAAETGREGGLGAAAALSSLIYGPVKVLYATGGLVVGAFAWAFTAGDTEVAEKVFTRSLRGTYVITPDILTGEKELVFIGRDVDDPPRMHTGTLASASGSGAGVTSEIESSARTVTTPGIEIIDDSGYDEMGW